MKSTPWVWAPSPSIPDLSSAFRRGEVYFGDLHRFKGRIRLTTDDGHRPRQRAVAEQLEVGVERPLGGREPEREPTVRLGLAASPIIPVNGAICWIEPDGLPRIRKLEVGGILIDGPRALADALRRPGPVPSKRARQIAAMLDRRLPPGD